MGSHGNEIKPLGQESISRIVAEQAITDLSSIVKELVDNALDADGTTIKIRLFGHGLQIIEVSDDGVGVPEASRPFLCTRYSTSKITCFEDIYTGTGLTMGFRGEALFSMACLSRNLVVATRTDADEMAQKLEFGRDGAVDAASVQSLHRKLGTTVAVIEPFAALPARRADMERRIKAERSKLFQLIQAYAIFNVGVQFNLIDIVGGREDVALATSASSSSLEETVSAVLGYKVLTSLTRIQIDLKDILPRKQQTDDDICCNWELSGLISKSPQATMGRAFQYFCINGRVVQLPKIAALLRKLWNGFGGRKRPTCVLTLSLPNNTFDINLSPDKLQVLLTHEEAICEVLQETVSKLWASQTHGVFQAQSIDIPVAQQQPQHDTRVTQQTKKQQPEEGGRQMHKRRFAFVHDLAKAKMQHDLADRQVLDGSEEKKQTDCEHRTSQEAEPEPAKQSVVGTQETGRPTKKAKVVSREELTLAASGEASGSNSNTNTRSTTSHAQGTMEDRVSDLDRRKWNEIQSKFKRVEDEDLPPLHQSPILPVTPDDLVAAAKPSGDASSFERKPSRRVQKDTPSSSALLQQFAFRPTKRKTHREGATETVETGESAPEPRSSRKRILNTQNVRKRLHVEVDSMARTSPLEQTEEGTSDKDASVDKEDASESEKRSTSTREALSRLAASGRVDGTTSAAKSENRSTGEVEIESSRSVKQKEAQTPNQPETSKTPTPRGNDDKLQLPEKVEEPSSSQQRILWESFNSIKDVCSAARVQRLKMQKRKRQLADMQRPTPDQQLDEEAKAVSQSVGESTSTGTSSVINLSKSQFRNGMDIIGQFNMGFILARDRNNHLWILDQHAIDEKYRFENLCRDTVLHEQKLLKPMPLESTPAEEACILDHLEIFKANGFHFEFKPEAPIRHRLFLTALPHSGAHAGRKAVQFGKDDVSALCSILSDGCSYDAGDGGTGTDGNGMYGNNAVRRYASTASTQADSANRIVARLPKAIAMFASRACRTSIMIGTSLSQKEMDKLVKQLADVEHPWNCPHGRPTMRHVGEILPILRNDERQAADHFTGPTVTVTPFTQEPAS